MVHHRLGNAREAQRWLDELARDISQQTRETSPANWWDWEECQLLRREAEALVKGAKP
jgi:hypothetical protein